MRFFLIGFLACWSLLSAAQSVEKGQNWSAHWIWLPKEDTSSVMLARQKFTLAEIPAAATLRITATSQYELYLNGTYVRRGPARSAPHHQSFDALEVAPYLRVGQNQVAVRVHYLKGTTSYHQQGRGGLLAQLNVEGATAGAVVQTDEQWKVAPDKGWSEAAPRTSRFQLVVNDLVDFRQRQRNWQALNYKDSAWGNARPLLREHGWPKLEPKATPQAHTPPWTRLVPREVPLLREVDVPATTLVQAEQLEL
ncbi:MAG: alpha-L-rhamnosidase N-terminal domain-containing protein, partial [Bacteroidota bacterium]